MASPRNRLEKAVSARLGDGWAYEPIRLSYVLECQYVPDFVDVIGKRIIETKGLFDATDRRKMLAVKAAHPDWSFELVFSNPNAKITKRSKTTYREWCEKHGFAWSRGPRS